MSFEELRSLGIDNPAVLAYELDLVGMPIERVHRYDAPGRAVPVGVRIEEPDATPATLVHSPRPRYPPRPQVARVRWRRRAYEAREFARARLSAAVATGSTARARLRAPDAGSIAARAAQRPALAAPLALLVVAGVVIALALTGQAPRRASTAADRTGLGAQRDARAAVRPGSARQAPRPAGAQASSTTPTSTPAASDAAGGSGASTQRSGTSGATRTGTTSAGASRPPEAAPTAAASASAAQLQANGHQLIGDGRYAAAIGDLRAALTASGQSTASCGAPTSEACLTYAYALYDIGVALRLDGDPGAAVGVLSERLRIDNQRATVQEQLDLAKAAADSGRAAPAPGVRTLDGGVRAPGNGREDHHGRPHRAH